MPEGVEGDGVEQRGGLMAKNAVDLESEDLSLRRWSEEADVLKREVLELCRTGSEHYPELDKSFGVTLREITRFQIRDFAGGAFAFDPSTGVFTINAAPLLSLLARVEEDIASSIGAADEGLSQSTLTIQIKVFRTYLLHEICHIRQGVGCYGTVQALKRIAGPKPMSDLDILADRDAAAVFAALECQIDGGSRDSYLDHFKRALFFSGMYSFPTFKFDSSRPFKMARAIALTIMAVRLIEAGDMTESEEMSRLPLDAALTVSVNGDYDSFAIMAGAPQAHVIRTLLKIEGNELRELVTAIEEARFIDALDAAVSLMRLAKVFCYSSNNDVDDGGSALVA